MIAGLEDVVAHFRFEGRFVAAAPYGRGHINDTYAAQCVRPDGSTCRYVLQRINQHVFRDPDGLMRNIEGVTKHLRARIEAAGGDPARETLNLVPVAGGGVLYRTPEGDCWRAYEFIEGAQTYDVAISPEHVYNVAQTFGRFQCLLADYPVDALVEVIPDFHNTPKRFEAFVAAVERDSHNRARDVCGEIRCLEDRAADTAVLVALLRQGKLPLRVTHNDTKFDNVMIDNRTSQGICIVDLDTVMPGLALYDFADAVRSGAALTNEDDPDLARAGISLETFDCLARGYLDAARAFLTPAEIDHLAFSARLITLEQTLRFLTDYLSGDVYYKIHRPAHNLDRARNQLRLLQDLEEKYDQLVAIVSRYR